MADISPFLAASEVVFSFTLSARMPATAVSISFVCCTSKGFKVACRQATVFRHMHVIVILQQGNLWI